MTLKDFYSLLFLFTIFHLSAQNLYKSKLDRFVIDQKQEKIYLHFDSPHYVSGEQLWFKAYITDATSHLPTEVSSTLFVELINQEKTIIDSLTLFIKDGTTHGSFSLGPDLEPGNYRVRAYTEWMRNFDNDFFYKRDIAIVNPLINENLDTLKEVSHKRRLNADFLPEGGDLIDDVPTKIAIKVTDPIGRNVPVNGLIINTKGERITIFESNDSGYALCFFKPAIDESYLALIEEDTFNLPPVKDAGASIRVIHSRNSEDVHITVRSKNVDLKGGTLVIHRRGQFLFSEKCLDRSAMAIRIKKSTLKTGIIHITFFDKNQIPLSERLVFPNPPIKEPDIIITPDRALYAKRSKVRLELRSKSDTVHSASITINPQTESSYDKHGENIVNYLLFSSDLRGTIESPGSYFNNTKEAYKALDLLMLTHGWSRFDWTSLLDDTDFSPEYLPDDGLKISGRAVNYYSNKSLKEPLIGITIPTIGVLNEIFKANKDGTFLVDGLKLMDSTSIYIQTFKDKNEKTKKYLGAKIRLEYPLRPEVAYFPKDEMGINPDFLNKMKKLKKISDAYFLDSEATRLEEVVVTAKTFEQDEMDARTLYLEPSNRLILDSLGFAATNQSVFELLRQVPGVTISGSFPNQSALIRGYTRLAKNNEPAYFIDGMPVDNVAIQSIPIQIVEFIDVLKDSKAAIYGARGARGAILVYTRRGKLNLKEEKPTGLFAFTHPGYHKAKEFYSPQYDIDRKEHIIPDFRTTLYWDPELKFENHDATSIFYSSDQTGSFTIRVEGMYTNGKPFFEERFINVE